MDALSIARGGLTAAAARYNTMSERVAGADAERGLPELAARPEAAVVNGAIRVSLKIEGGQGEQIEKALRDAGATDVQMGGG